MNIDLNRVRFEIVNEFNNFFDKMSNYDIGLVSDTIEMRMLSIIEDYALENINQIITNSKLENLFIKTISVNGQHFKIRIQESLENSELLIIAFLRVFEGKKIKTDFAKENFEVEHLGRIKNFQLMYPSSLIVEVGKLSALIKLIIGTCYNWLFQKVCLVIRENHIYASKLYQSLKIELGDKRNLSKAIWFVTIINNKCVLLLDDENVEYAFSKITAHNYYPEITPHKFLDIFINMRLSYEKAFALRAAKEGRCISGDIFRGEYFDDLPLLSLSLISVFSKDISVYPILTEDSNYLFASFATKHRKVVEPILDLSKENIIKDYKNLYSNLRRMFNHLDNRKLDLDKIGSFLGNFIGGIGSSIFKP